YRHRRPRHQNLIQIVALISSRLSLYNAADAIITIAGERKRFQGKVERKEEGYAFVRFPEFVKAIFASRADSDVVEWDFIAANSTVTASVGFNRRGPRVLKIAPSGPASSQR
ncbi:hypothetical protein ACCS93_38105, partial [Rhizobium ruizarguesonis]